MSKSVLFWKMNEYKFTSSWQKLHRLSVQVYWQISATNHDWFSDVMKHGLAFKKESVLNVSLNHPSTKLHYFMRLLLLFRFLSEKCHVSVRRTIEKLTELEKSQTQTDRNSNGSLQSLFSSSQIASHLKSFGRHVVFSHVLFITL